MVGIQAGRSPATVTQLLAPPLAPSNARMKVALTRWPSCVSDPLEVAMSAWTYDALAEGCGPFRCDCGENLHPTEIVACETAADGGCVIRCLRCAMAAGASDVPVEVVER